MPVWLDLYKTVISWSSRIRIEHTVLWTSKECKFFNLLALTRSRYAGKEKEWDEYRTHVSNWELEKYLITY